MYSVYRQLPYITDGTVGGAVRRDDVVIVPYDIMRKMAQPTAPVRRDESRFARIDRAAIRAIHESPVWVRS